eukprot:CAMPEP_0174255692 /NCGR_PEP_ID=MMETSP0439-20130205/5010_1 /TAXON_ID=0 /ORGANISM="Stereomyxa ramosa, Strain Chinc5" /LENGTH=453 /DNA_ID=CAMNT_0015337989 /DNA_START=380 /DNA_END=1738 /DNA_ORIENTATION=-
MMALLSTNLDPLPQVCFSVGKFENIVRHLSYIRDVLRENWRDEEDLERTKTEDELITTTITKLNEILKSVRDTSVGLQLQYGDYQKKLKYFDVGLTACNGYASNISSTLDQRKVVAAQISIATQLDVLVGSFAFMTKETRKIGTKIQNTRTVLSSILPILDTLREKSVDMRQSAKNVIDEDGRVSERFTKISAAQDEWVSAMYGLIALDTQKRLQIANKDNAQDKIEKYHSIIEKDLLSISHQIDEFKTQIRSLQEKKHREANHTLIVHLNSQIQTFQSLVKYLEKKIDFTRSECSHGTKEAKEAIQRAEYEIRKLDEKKEKAKKMVAEKEAKYNSLLKGVVADYEGPQSKHVHALEFHEILILEIAQQVNYLDLLLDNFGAHFKTLHNNLQKDLKKLEKYHEGMAVPNPTVGYEEAGVWTGFEGMKLIGAALQHVAEVEESHAITKNFLNPN